ncbi:hypothetical protein ESOMN_v1c06580 [Williamsoniiplasma somnilux]|uniref:ABC3 transporter permease C-terminal domain-containing protein n=1 Tax=Williamsoniiplasma somnilux TaxID=215578 RepID=A0A2K8NYY4_9MOLU|nr:FtsX-like permease family protein [Williamsoniiplasma somnilux]ATZ19040.1 hypothetical protein ESOMN_v1c06580 [Williamsoniiplasma somnilux]
MVKLIFKEAIFNLKRKSFFYFSFFFFLIIVMGIIISLLSFGLNLSNQLKPALNTKKADTVLQLYNYDSSEESLVVLSDLGIENINELIEQKSKEQKVIRFNNKEKERDFKISLAYRSGYIFDTNVSPLNEIFIAADDYNFSYSALPQIIKEELAFFDNNIYYWFIFNKFINIRNVVFDYPFELLGNLLNENNEVIDDVSIYLGQMDNNFYRVNNDSKFTVTSGIQNSQSGIYLTEKTLANLNLKIGDYLTISYQDSDDPENSYIKEKIVGTAFDYKTISRTNNSIFLTQESWNKTKKIIQGDFGNFYNDIKFSFKNSPNIENLNFKINESLFSLHNGVVLKKLPITNSSDSIDIAVLIGQTLPLLLIMIAFFIVILLCFVNWMVTSQSSKLNIKNLVTLKNEGTKNWMLSLLNTFEIFIPLLLSTIVGTFVGLFFQKIISEIVFQKMSFHWEFWHTTWITWIIIIITYLIILGSFAILNLYIIKTVMKSYKIEIATTSAKINSKILYKTNPKFKIRAHLALSNFGKNVSMFLLTGVAITTFILSTSLTVSLRKMSYDVIDVYTPYNSISYHAHKNRPFNNDRRTTALTILEDEKNFDKLSAEDISTDDFSEEIIKLLDFINKHYTTDLSLDRKGGYLTIDYLDTFAKKFRTELEQYAPEFLALLDSEKELKKSFPGYEGSNLFLGKFFANSNKTITGLKRTFYDVNRPEQSYSITGIDTNKWAKHILPIENPNDDGIINISVSERGFIDGKYEMNQILDLKDPIFVTKNEENQTWVPIKFKISKVIKGDHSLWFMYVDQKLVERHIINFIHNIDSNSEISNISKEYIKNFDIKNLTQNRNFVIDKEFAPFFLSNLVLAYEPGKTPIEVISKIQNIFAGIRGFSTELMAKEIYARSKLIRDILQFVSIIVLLIDVLTIILLSSMVVYQNKKTLTVMKTMGYKKFELTSYIAIGYILSCVLGIVLAIIMNKVAFDFILKNFNDALGGLEFIYGIEYWSSLVTITISYIFIIITTVYSYIGMIKQTANPD